MVTEDMRTLIRKRKAMAEQEERVQEQLKREQKIFMGEAQKIQEFNKRNTMLKKKRPKQANNNILNAHNKVRVGW